MEPGVAAKDRPGTEAKVTQVTVCSHGTQSDPWISPPGPSRGSVLSVETNILKENKGKDRVTLSVLLISDSSGSLRILTRCNCVS